MNEENKKKVNDYLTNEEKDKLSHLKELITRANDDEELNQFELESLQILLKGYERIEQTFNNENSSTGKDIFLKENL